MYQTFNFNQYGHGGFKTVLVASLLIVMLLLMAGGRLLSRNLQKARLAADDYTLFLATGLNLSLCAIAIAMPRIAGAGDHVAVLDQVDPLKEPILEQSYIAWMVLYAFAVASSKIAILLLYVRVFTTRNQVFIASCSAMGFIIVATCLATAFGAIFQCTPVQYAWNKDIHGSCIDNLAFERYTAIPNVITGAVMLAIPMPLVWELKIAPAAKVALTATFLHGIIGVVASAARLGILFHSQAAGSLNDTAIAWTIWTINEPSNYVIAACLPTLRPIFLRILPSSFFVLSGNRGSSNKPYTSSPKGSRQKLGSERNEIDVYMTSPHFTGPWTTRYEHEERASAERELSSADGGSSLPKSNIRSNLCEDVENGKILVTTTVEI